VGDLSIRPSEGLTSRWPRNRSAIPFPTANNNYKFNDMQQTAVLFWLESLRQLSCHFCTSTLPCHCTHRSPLTVWAVPKTTDRLLSQTKHKCRLRCWAPTRNRKYLRVLREITCPNSCQTQRILSLPRRQGQIIRLWPRTKPASVSHGAHLFQSIFKESVAPVFLRLRRMHSVAIGAENHASVDKLTDW